MKHPRPEAYVLCALLIGAGGCGGGSASGGNRSDGGGTQDTGIAGEGGPGTGDAGSAAEVAGGTRRSSLASVGIQFKPRAAFAYDYTPDNLAEDVDVFSMHEEFHGLPWAEFEAGTEPPAEWVNIIDRHAGWARSAGKPVVLSLSIGREYLQDKVVVKDGQATRFANWSARCFDFAAAPDGAAKRTAYLRYVEWMVRRFQPKWVNVDIESNLFSEKCEAAWPGKVVIINAAYDAVKKLAPDAIVFASFALQNLYGLADCKSPKKAAQCYEERYAKLAGIKRDRFGVSAYPYLADGVRSLADVPRDYFTRAAEHDPAHPERVVIAETGWNSTNVVAMLDGSCTTAFRSTEAEQRDYFELLIGIAREKNIDLVTWWENRDLLVSRIMTDCPCTFDKDWCAGVEVFRSTGGSDPVMQYLGELLFKVWGTMGIRDYGGTAKAPIMAAWQAARAPAIH